MDSPIIMLIAAFIGISIMLMLGVSIMAGFNQSLACWELGGFTGSTVADRSDPDMYSADTWGATCMEIQMTSQDSVGMLVVILTVVGAVVILIVIRYL